MEEPVDSMDSVLEDRFEACLTYDLADQVLVFRRGDEELRELVTILEKPEHCRTKQEKGKVSDYILKNDRLMRVIEQDGKKK